MLAGGFILGQTNDGRSLIGSASHVVQPSWSASAGRSEQALGSLVYDSWPETKTVENRFLKPELVYMPAWDASTFPQYDFDLIPYELDIALGVTDSVKLPERYQAEPIIAKTPARGLVLGVGYPLENGIQISGSIGRVLSGDAAVAFHQKYASSLDQQHQPIDPKVSFIVLAKATQGMSGGPVFDSGGRLIGTMVAGGTTNEGQDYFVAVKAEWIAETAHQKLGQLIPKPTFAPMRCRDL